MCACRSWTAVWRFEWLPGAVFALAVVLLPAASFGPAIGAQDVAVSEAGGGEAWARGLLQRLAKQKEGRFASTMEHYARALAGARPGPQEAAVLISLGDRLSYPGAPSLSSELSKTVSDILERGDPKVRTTAAKLLEGGGWLSFSRDSLLCYLAACAVNPNSARAWSRVAIQAVEFRERQAADYVLKELRKAYPRNALPHYLFAVRQMDGGAAEKALALVLEGTERDYLDTYEAPYPRGVSISYPRTEPFAEASVAGKPVPESALVYAASVKLGLDLVRSRPPGVMKVLTGVAMYKSAAPHLLATYEEAESEKAEALREHGREVDALVGVCRELVECPEGKDLEAYEKMEREQAEAALRGEDATARKLAALRETIEALPPLPAAIAEEARTGD